MYAPVERDGPTRNGLGLQALRGLGIAGSDTEVCLWLKYLGCPTTAPGNDCGVPHSQASEADNLGLAPFTLYWNFTQRYGQASFLAPGQLGAPPVDWNVTEWDRSRNQCVHQGLTEYQKRVHS